MDKIDINYNYLNDVGSGEFSKATFSSKNRKDPDSLSKRLYEDLNTLFCNNRILQNGDKISESKDVSDNYGNFELKVTVEIKGLTDNKIFTLGSDYIGPSVYWASQAGLQDYEIGSFLEVARTIGGHVLWWKRTNYDMQKVYYNYVLESYAGTKEYKEFQFNKAEKDSYYQEVKAIYKSIKAIPITINNSRGGEYGFYDRIDLTLFDLKQWYLEQPCKLQKAFENSREWLLLFKNFKGFVNYFLLQDFVNEDYEIKNLTSFYENKKYKILTINDVYPSSIPRDFTEYKIVADGLTEIIKKRNVRIQRLIL